MAQGQRKVNEIFNNEIFSIPNYQRDYAWGVKNLDDLWEDLLEAEKAKNDEMGHFLGTIVVAKNPKNKATYDIIDGQQRATTLFMLRYTLNCKAGLKERNFNHYHDENDNLRLQVIDENKAFFAKLLKQADNDKLDSSLENEIKTDGQKRLFEVFQTIWSYTNNLNNQEAKELLAVLDKMVLMWLEEKDAGGAIRMFQTVNDRGMPLLILDKLKALLILYSNKYCAGRLDDIINERFGRIFKAVMKIRKHEVAPSLADRDFQKEIEARIFNYHALGQKDIGHYEYGADESYKKLKDLLKVKVKDLQNTQELEKWLDNYSKDLCEFSEAFFEVVKMTETNIEAFKNLFILRINPFFYPTLVRLKMNGILDDECLKLLAQAEIFFFGLDSSNRASAYKLYEFANDKNTFKKEIIKSCIKCSKGGYKNIKELIEYIAEKNYERGKYFHYIFLTYHSKNMDIADFKKLVKEKTYAMSIEHIVPQNAPENGSLHQYGFENEADFNIFKNTFGNLLVLESSLNSENKDYGQATRQENYKKSCIFYNREFANAQNFLSFGKNDIIKENENFTAWAREFFKDFL